jgi:hypothetical protein
MELAFLLDEPNVTEFGVAGQRLMILHVDSYYTGVTSQFPVLQKESPETMDKRRNR